MRMDCALNRVVHTTKRIFSRFVAGNTKPMRPTEGGRREIYTPGDFEQNNKTKKINSHFSEEINMRT